MLSRRSGRLGVCWGGAVLLRASGGLSGRGDRVDYCWGGQCVGLGGQFWGLAGGAVLRRGAGSLRGPGVVAAGSGSGGRTALAWVVMLGLGPGVWALPGAPGGPCQWGLGCPGHATVWVGWCRSWCRAGCSGTSDVSTGCWFFRVLGRAVGWGGAFPLLGGAWVGLGDGGSQAWAAATGVTA